MILAGAPGGRATAQAVTDELCAADPEAAQLREALLGFEEHLGKAADEDGVPAMLWRIHRRNTGAVTVFTFEYSQLTPAIYDLRGMGATTDEAVQLLAAVVEGAGPKFRADNDLPDDMGCFPDDFHGFVYIAEGYVLVKEAPSREESIAMAAAYQGGEVKSIPGMQSCRMAYAADASGIGWMITRVQGEEPFIIGSRNDNPETGALGKLPNALARMVNTGTGKRTPIPGLVDDEVPVKQWAAAYAEAMAAMTAKT